jgi:hypothetical protein
MRHLSLSILVLSNFVLTSGCSWLNEKFGATSKVTFQLPAKVMSTQSIRTSSHIEGGWGLQAPTSVGAVDCYGVYIHASDFEPGACSNQNGESIPFSRLYGLFPAGSQVSLETKAGPGRTIGVFAFQSATGKCTGATQSGFNPSDYSQPVLVGSVTMDLVVGENQATISGQMTGARAVNSCRSGFFANLPNQVWPAACSTQIRSMAYNDSRITISGSCLDGTTQVSIRDNRSGNSTSLKILEVTGSAVTAGLEQSISILAGQSYSLLISTAHAQTAVPLTLTLGDNSVPLGALITTGAADGQVLTYDQATARPAWKTPPSGNSQLLGKAVFVKDGATNTAVGRLLQVYPDQSGALQLSIFPGTFPMLGSYPPFSLHYVQFNKTGPLYLGYPQSVLMQPLDPQILESSVMTYLDGPYFSNADCTGDIYFKTWSYPHAVDPNTRISNKTFPMLNTCSDGSQAGCPSVTYKKFLLENLQVVESFEGITLQSKIGFDGNRADVSTMYGLYCAGVANETQQQKGYRLPNPAANIVNLGAGDTPGIIQSLQLSY